MKTQMEISGTERLTVPELEAACEALLKAKARKAKAAERMKDCEHELQDALVAHQIEQYWYVDGDRRWSFAREQVQKTKVTEIVKKAKRKGDVDETDVEDSMQRVDDAIRSMATAAKARGKKAPRVTLRVDDDDIPFGASSAEELME